MIPTEAQIEAAKTTYRCDHCGDVYGRGETCWCCSTPDIVRAAIPSGGYRYGIHSSTPILQGAAA